jgi:hypothetical protein
MGDSMSVLDFTADGVFGNGRIGPAENAVNALLKQPALSYTRGLRRSIEEYPNFMTFYGQSVGLEVHNILTNEGICWDDDVFEKEFLKVVMEAITRLRSKEK